MKKLYSLLLTVVLTGVAIAQDTAVNFKAEISNRNGDVLYIRDNRGSVINEMKADEKGNFKSSFEVTDGFYQMFDGVEYAQLYLKKGYDLKLTMNAKQFDETIKFTGKGAAENNYLNRYVLADSEFDYEGLLTKDPATFNKTMEDKKAADLKSLENAKLDTEFTAILKQNIEMTSAQMTKMYNKKLEAAKMNNTPSPSFDFENHKGGKTSLESLKGKYVYIDVWATWCGPCRAEIPHLKNLEEKFHGKNVEFVSISADQIKDHDKWKQFVTDKGLQGIQLFADKSFESDFIKAYGINSIPRFILIDPKGMIINSDADRPSNPKLEEQLNSLLK